MSSTVLSQDHGDWVEITLNRPERLNAFNEELHLALRAALAQAAEQKARAVLITGAGRGFCAGQDLADEKLNQGGIPDLSQAIRDFYTPLVQQIRDLPCPVVAAINGVAAGAGANFALSCDMILAAHSASFIQSFANIGLLPDTGGSWHLPRLLGEARAKALALTGEPLPAQKAEDWGLIYKAVPDAELMDQARALTAKLAAGPTVGLAATKKAINAASMNTLDQQLDLEAELMGPCGRSEDFVEGVTAFLQKRPAKFSGK